MSSMDVRSLKAQVEALRARVTDLEKWESQVAAVSIRKHSGKKRVRKHLAGYLRVRKH